MSCTRLWSTGRSEDWWTDLRSVRPAGEAWYASGCEQIAQGAEAWVVWAPYGGGDSFGARHHNVAEGMAVFAAEQEARDLARWVDATYEAARAY